MSTGWLATLMCPRNYEQYDGRVMTLGWLNKADHDNTKEMLNLGKKEDGRCY